MTIEPQKKKNIGGGWGLESCDAEGGWNATEKIESRKSCEYGQVYGGGDAESIRTVKNDNTLGCTRTFERSKIEEWMCMRVCVTEAWMREGWMEL